MDDPARKELVRLVELDYDRTTRFIEAIVGISGAVRGAAITVWVAVVGIAAAQKLWPLGIVAAALVLVFAVVDAYHAWRYQEALSHAQAAERATRAYYGSVARGSDDPGMRDEADLQLAAHSFGVYSQLRRFRWNDLRFAKPEIFFQALYPAMAAAGVIEALLLGLLVRSP